MHYAPLATEDLTEADRIPVTSLERTHLDLAARAPSALPGLLERSEKSQRFDLRKFEALLGRTKGHPGRPTSSTATGPTTASASKSTPSATHGSRRSFERDRKRQRELRHRYGIEVERVTDAQLEGEPREVLAAIGAALERRRRTAVFN